MAVLSRACDLISIFKILCSGNISHTSGRVGIFKLGHNVWISSKDKLEIKRAKLLVSTISKSWYTTICPSDVNCISSSIPSTLCDNAASNEARVFSGFIDETI